MDKQEGERQAEPQEGTSDEGPKLPVLYEYARFGTWLQAALSIPFYVLLIWTLTIPDEPRWRLFTLFALIYGTAINTRALFRLTEKIRVTEEYVERETPFGLTRIRWEEVKSVRIYFSWLEGNSYLIESMRGEKISVSQMLWGYDELYRELSRRAPWAVP
jgi:hypothetical protein